MTTCSPPQSQAELGEYVFVIIGLFFVLLLAITLAAILGRDKGPPRS